MKSDPIAVQWLRTRGIEVPGEDYVCAIRVNGPVAALYRKAPKAWSIFLGGEFTRPTDDISVPPRKRIRRYLSPRIEEVRFRAEISLPWGQTLQL